MDTHLDTALLTVGQAQHRWCPEARSTSAEYPDHVDPPTVNRRLMGSADAGSKCLGDGCMYWRWHDRGARRQPHAATAPARIEVGYEYNASPWRAGLPDEEQDWKLDEENSVWFVEAPDLPPRGYCGKAGHPYAAALLEAQLELVRLQLYDHHTTV